MLIACLTCEQLKEETEFYNYKHDRVCKVCARALAKQKRLENPEQVRAWDRKRYYRNRKQRIDDNTWSKQKKPELYNAINRRNRFSKIHPDVNAWYDIQFKKQNGKCAMCEWPAEKERYGRLSIDHDHKTLRLRGLLCNRCNTDLGVYEECYERAEKYLREYAI